MRLPPFEYAAPETLAEAVKIKGELSASASILAGGTDLIVNLKHRLLAPGTLVSLRKIQEIKRIGIEADSLVIGAGASLADICRDSQVVRHFPILVRAIESIGAIGIQRFRGTIGGNVCLQPRCIFYNQTHFWRLGKGACHRTGGKECHALPGSDSCQSILSGDAAPALVALSAMVEIAGAGGKRIIPLTEFFTGRGVSPIALAPDELLAYIRIPLPWAPLSWSYQRISIRSAVDFPLANAAATAIVANGKVERFRLVLAALGPAPVILKEAEAAAKGKPVNPEVVNIAGESAFRAAEGIVAENASASRDYRIKMARVVARRAARQALGL
jgi:4-hydroxybenzoyl-CoA reductase subunit beta